MNKYEGVEISKEDERNIADYQEGYDDGQSDGFQEGYDSAIEDFYNGYLEYNCPNYKDCNDDCEYSCFHCYKKWFDKNVRGICD